MIFPHRSLVTLGAAALCSALSCPPAWSSPAGIEGRWSGALSFRGDTTAVALEIAGGPGGPSALLDLPELVMHREPVRAERAGGGVAVELPFGIGSITLLPDGGELRGSRELGKETITVELRPDPGAPLPSRELEIRRDGAILRGTLVSPAGPGPHPAVVVLHGSATVSRESWGYRSWARAMARRGVAALVTDRRGSGESTSAGPGTPDFGTLAGDALAWVELLRAIPGIRPDSVGLMGGSQAGWVAPMAAARSDSVAFLILKAAPGVTPAEQEIHSAVGRARAGQMDPGTIGDLRSYLRLYFFVAATGRGWDLLEAEIRRAEAAPWGELVDQPRSLEDLAWWGRQAGIDPAEILPQVSVPVLAAYGTADLIVPPQPNAPILERLLRSGGNHNVRVMILEGADHRLELPMGSGPKGRWRWPRIAPEFLDAAESWIREFAESGRRRSREPAGSCPVSGME